NLFLAALRVHCPGFADQTARELVQQRRNPAHALQLHQLLVQVLEVEVVALFELASKLLGLFAIEIALNVLDQRQHIAHAQDTGGDAISAKRLERLSLLASTDEKDWPARDLPHRQGCAAA